MHTEACPSCHGEKTNSWCIWFVITIHLAGLKVPMFDGKFLSLLLIFSCVFPQPLHPSHTEMPSTCSSSNLENLVREKGLQTYVHQPFHKVTQIASQTITGPQINAFRQTSIWLEERGFMRPAPGVRRACLRSSETLDRLEFSHSTICKIYRDQPRKEQAVVEQLWSSEQQLCRRMADSSLIERQQYLQEKSLCFHKQYQFYCTLTCIFVGFHWERKYLVLF